MDSGVEVGRVFRDRAELAASGVHRPRRQGIGGSAASGAESVVISGAYEDDRDLGDVILYTGEGGRDAASGRQVADQLLTRGNRALARACDEGRSVRVIRGSGLASPFAPGEGYRYDGPYRVEGYWHDRGASGFLVWRFLLRREEGPASGFGGGSSVRRVVRSSATGAAIRALYDHRCQACGVRLETPAGPYAESAHLRPVEGPHDGPDVPENVVCLCPNHLVLFERGAFVIGDDLGLIGLGGRLAMRPGHSLDSALLAYRREHWGGGRTEGRSAT